MKAKSVSKAVSKPVSDNDADDYQAQSDASTLASAQEIQSDPDRHQKATDHLAKKAKSSGDAHQANRKLLEKKTKKRLNKVFNGKDFEQEKDSEKAGTQKIVNED